jgi:PPK2 family polyphosphate:nucleotide phosphotransferase
MIDSPYLVKPGKKFKLSDVSPDDTGKFKDKDDARDAIAKKVEKLGELQDLLFAESQRALLVVLQGMDAAGKDGTIEHVFSAVNPQGCTVTPFKVPSSREKSQDFLWRYHLAAPQRGLIGIFNRSHYESVLVERVKKITPEKVWKSRYEHINNFEKLLSDEGTVVVKFYLHISKAEQKKRLQERLEDKTKNWKFNPGDLDERGRWGDYMEAFEDALSKCSTEHAPWYCVPADHKWFRNWVVSDVIVRTLEELKLKYPPPAPGIEKIVVK